jgi:glucan 1,3-beta-glucosidase
MDARPNSWTPPLNTSWRWGIDRAQGVNLGGWFVLEPFITPGIFQKYPGSEDEHSLTTMMRAAGTLDELEEHYKTFIVRRSVYAHLPRAEFVIRRSKTLLKLLVLD